MTPHNWSRRSFLGTALQAGAGLSLARGIAAPWRSVAPATITSDALRPVLPSGVQSGDVLPTRAMIWSRADRPARMWVEWSTDAAFRNVRRVRGPAALQATGGTAALDLGGLPSDAEIFYRVQFDSLDHPGALSAPAEGRFRTPPALDGSSRSPRALRVAFSGDCAGQGWGIDEARGGMRIYEAMRRAEPDVFIHSGDIIYADQPLESEVRLEDGTLWRNLLTPEKSKVAETLEEFRGNFAYHLLDENARRFHAEVPIVAQWDDHEVVDNWFPGYRLDHDDRYTVKSASLLAERARRALFEFLPIRPHPDTRERIYRKFSYGPLLEIFVIDLRSYRGPNTPNMQGEESELTEMMGNEQLAWLKGALRQSRAVWKVVASDMPIGLVVPDRRRDGERTFEAWANADDGPPAGRELEIARLLAFLQRERIRNVVWVTADVHYAAAHHYAPGRASFHAFDPFWEFVAGPMHAGTFGPNQLDGTFGPEVRFSAFSPTPNAPPSAGLQFFGLLDIEPEDQTLTASIVDVAGTTLWSTQLAPELG